MTTDLILGTAGHIDHGKTSLIHALTGVNTDRLPEEQRRGITIDLGFAELELGEYRLGAVDVPGHERFVKNMLAGATGLDVVLLVVAADDAIKPQTREHLEILRLLELEAGVIALTKCDLVEPDWLDLVESEIRALVADTFLATAPLVRTSVVTRQGLDELRQQLATAAARAAQSPRMGRLAGPFRMAIDRSFTVAGYGTVVTGSVSSGRVQVGDALVLEPGAVEVRVRGLQNHDRPVAEIHRGQRAAINLAGVHHQEIRRGQELAALGHLRPSRWLTVSLSVLPSAPRPLKTKSRVRLHVGTAELLASVVTLEGESIAPGQTALAQLFLNAPAATVWHQPFVLRSESPVLTIGGGRILDGQAERLRQPTAAVLQQLRELNSPEPLRRASAALYLAGLRDWQPRDLARSAGIDNGAEMHQQLLATGELREIAISPTRRLRVHRLILEQLQQRIEAALLKLHEQQPLRTMLDRQQLTAGFRYLGESALLEVLLEDLARQQRIRLSAQGIALAGQGPKLSQNERKLLAELIAVFRQAGVQTPGVRECQAQAARNQQAVPHLLALAVADGELLQIAADYYLHVDVERQLRAMLRERLADGRPATLSELREWLQTTRKYAIPYCEYLDHIGFTRRAGDVRYLNEASIGSAGP